MARKTKEDAEKTRSQLLDSALALFSEQSPERVTLSQIASHAGTTRGAIYWHFKDKIAMMTCLWNEATTQLEEILEATVENSSHTPLECLQRMLQELLTIIATDQRMQQVFKVMLRCRHISEFKAPVCEQQQTCLVHFTRLMEQAHKLDQLRPPLTPHMGAVILVTALDGLMEYYLNDSAGQNLEQDAPLVAETYIHMVKNHDTYPA